MFRGLIDNFVKGFCLIWKGENNSYYTIKTFKDIFWTNVNIFSITVVANHIRLILPNHIFSDILYYTFILRIFINGIIANTFMSMTLGRIVLNSFKEKNLVLNIQENNGFSELIFKEAKIAFYSKIYYIGELLIITLLPAQSVYYRIFSVYFYGKYMTEIYLDIRDISSRIHNRYLSRLIFFRIGIGCMMVLLFWIFEITIGTYGTDLVTRVIFNDCIFNIMYGYYITCFEDTSQAPRLEEYEPFFLHINSDYLFRKVLVILSIIIRNISIHPIIKDFLCKLGRLFLTFFIDTRIKEDPLSYPPILHCTEVYQKEILQVLHTLLIYNKIGPFLNDKITLFFLSVWVPRELIKLAIGILNKVDYKYVGRLHNKIKELEVDFFILAENKDENNFTLVQQAVSQEGDMHFYLSEAKSLTHKEIMSIRANPSPTTFTPNFNSLIIDNYFK